MGQQLKRLTRAEQQQQQTRQALVDAAARVFARRGLQGSSVEMYARYAAMAAALIALDIGLAIQHFVDPDDAPLDLYPQPYELLFSPLAASDGQRRAPTKKRSQPRSRKAPQ